MRDLRTGGQLNYATGSPGQTSSIYLHPNTAEAFYVEVDEFSGTSDTTWSIRIEQ